MRRAFTIAVREYLAFVRTVGFWLSICLMPMGLMIALFATGMGDRIAPPPRVAIIDLTGTYEQALSNALGGPADPKTGARRMVLVPAPGGPFSDAAAAGRAVRPYLATTDGAPGTRLDAVAIVHGPAAAPSLDLWTRNLIEPGLQQRVPDALATAVRQHRLESAGLPPALVRDAEDWRPAVAQFSPKSETKARVSARDDLPAVVGLAMGFVLYALTLTGAGILLNSVIEEKSTRILEVLLTSASPPEIIGGKILGAAAVTASALIVWATAAGFLVSSKDPRLLSEIAGVLAHRGLAAYFALYFVGGYLMYATLFTTIGAFCETTREAQTLLGPLMILLTVPIVFMGQAISHPDLPLLRVLSWIPPFTPFLMAARAASSPPLWEVAGTATLMFALTVVEVWVAGRAFRTGALASGRFDVRLLLASIAGAGERA